LGQLRDATRQGRSGNVKCGLDLSIAQEAVMCHAVRVRLSPAEKNEVRKLSGVLIPIYASVALVLFAVMALTHIPRSDEAIAVAKNATAASQSAPAQR
jgi:hypothetical protein